MFQSPRPTRDATLYFGRDLRLGAVSIPASHAGRDAISSFKCFPSADVSIPASHAGRDRAHRTGLFQWLSFNPRVPRGTRPAISPSLTAGITFQSPRPTRDATF